MTAILLRIIIYAAIIGFVCFSVRRVWRALTSQFRTDDKNKRSRDLQERARPDVIDLKRDSDGVYRPPEDRDR